ncbi:MAG: carboxylate--amine ligase, partial [Thermoleophilaceae bacterium]|nr:carboxylate--amine ligase [Thermoleophilaceae bacterium]
CVDLKEDAEGVPRPTEINCGRFFTTSYFFTAAGVNIPDVYVRLALGDPIPDLPRYNVLEEGLYWIRHIDCPAVLVTEAELRARTLPVSLSST